MLSKNVWHPPSMRQLGNKIVQPITQEKSCAKNIVGASGFVKERLLLPKGRYLAHDAADNLCVIREISEEEIEVFWQIERIVLSDEYDTHEEVEFVGFQCSRLYILTSGVLPFPRLVVKLKKFEANFRDRPGSKRKMSSEPLEVPGMPNHPAVHAVAQSQTRKVSNLDKTGPVCVIELQHLPVRI